MKEVEEAAEKHARIRFKALADIDVDEVTSSHPLYNIYTEAFNSFIVGAGWGVFIAQEI